MNRELQQRYWRALYDERIFQERMEKEEDGLTDTDDDVNDFIDELEMEELIEDEDFMDENNNNNDYDEEDANYNLILEPANLMNQFDFEYNNSLNDFLGN